MRARRRYHPNRPKHLESWTDLSEVPRAAADDCAAAAAAAEAFEGEEPEPDPEPEGTIGAMGVPALRPDRLTMVMTE